jgi:hypothetical protein
MEQFFGFLQLTASIIFAAFFLVSLFWAASWHSDKTGWRFSQSLTCVWWIAISIMVVMISLFTAFFRVFE